jgi:hypothetical protein
MTSANAGHRLGRAPRRNRTGDPILTMEPPGTAVRTAVSPGRARPLGPKLSVLLRQSYALTFRPCADRLWIKRLLPTRAHEPGSSPPLWHLPARTSYHPRYLTVSIGTLLALLPQLAAMATASRPSEADIAHVRRHCRSRQILGCVVRPSWQLSRSAWPAVRAGQPAAVAP